MTMRLNCLHYDTHGVWKKWYVIRFGKDWGPINRAPCSKWDSPQVTCWTLPNGQNDPPCSTTFISFKWIGSSVFLGWFMFSKADRVPIHFFALRRNLTLDLKVVSAVILSWAPIASRNIIPNIIVWPPWHTSIQSYNNEKTKQACQATGGLSVCKNFEAWAATSSRLVFEFLRSQAMRWN